MGKFSGDSFVFELTGELQDLRTRATRRTELNHYTNMDSGASMDVWTQVS